MPTVVNIKDKYLATKFETALSDEDMAAAHGAGFFEPLYSMISANSMKNLPDHFFDLRRASRIIGRQDKITEQQAFEKILQKPALLLKVFEIKPTKEWKIDKNRGNHGEEEGETPDDTDLKIALKAFYAEHHRPPKVNDGHVHLPEDSKSWAAIKRERQAAGLTSLGQMYAEVLKQEADAARMASFTQQPAETQTPDDAPAPVEEQAEAKEVRRELTPAETYEAIGKHLEIKGRLPGSGSAYIGLPECSYAWSTVVTKLQLKFGSVEVFVADYEFNNPQENPLPIPVKGPVIYCNEVFNAVVDGLNKTGKIPHIIGKHRAVDIDESFLLDRVMFAESLINDAAERPLNLAAFAKAAGLVKEEDGKLVPNTEHRLIKWQPTQQPA